MNKLTKLDQHFNRYMKELTKWLPDGIIKVDLPLLKGFDLLDDNLDERSPPALTRYFQVVESFEKITLINDQFVIWIVPQREEALKTLTLITMNHPNFLKLELAFLTSEPYNTSRLVLRVLEKFLFEIQENEEFIKRLANQKDHST